MSERRDIGKYVMKQVGEGGEGETFRPKALKKGVWKEKDLAIKNMSLIGNSLEPEERTGKSSDDGFSEEYKTLLENHHKQLKTVYGDLIPHARMIRNPDHPELYLVAQEYIETADPADIGAYYPVDVENDSVKKQLARFVATMKEQLRKQQRGEEGITLDLVDGNLVLSKDEARIVYLDSGLNKTLNVFTDVILYLARLAMLSGATAEEIRQDPFYTPTVMEVPELVSTEDDEDFYQGLVQAEEEAKPEEKDAEFS